MEITIRTMLIVVVALIVILVALTVVLNLSGGSNNAITGLFDWIKSMMG